MFAASRPLPSSSPSSAWRHVVQDQEEDLVQELIRADDVDAVLARMEGDHFRHLSPILRRMTSYDASRSDVSVPEAVSPPGGSPSPRAAAHRPPPPPPPPEPLIVVGTLRNTPTYQRAATALQPPSPPPPTSTTFSRFPYTPSHLFGEPAEGTTAPAASTPEQEAEMRYQATMDSWLRTEPLSRGDLHAPEEDRFEEGGRRGGIPRSSDARQPLSAESPRSDGATEANPALLPPLSPGSPLLDSGGRYHGDAQKGSATRSPRVTTTLAASVTPHGEVGDVGLLENASQSRIARQLQLLRNYRELAELCANTSNPHVDLFRSLPSEELARMQAEQLKALPQREQSPITVNNNFYFDTGSGERGDADGGAGGSGGGDGRVRNGYSNTPVASNGRLANGGVAARGASYSTSEVLTADGGVHSGPSNGVNGGTATATSSQSHMPPSLSTPRIRPLQSPQLSTAPDSPVAVAPLQPRGGRMAPPSPSRSLRARSYRSRPHDAHSSPTATTEEADSSYDGDAERADYIGDFLDIGPHAENNDDGGEEEEEYYEAGYPRPPPRIIEREQHRRFPHNNLSDDALQSSVGADNTQPSQNPPTAQLPPQQPQLPQDSYPDSHANKPTSRSPHNGNQRDASRSAPPNAHGHPGASRTSLHGGPGSEKGRCSVSSTINVLCGEHELRADAQTAKDSQQVPNERRQSIALSERAPQPTLSHPSQREQRRSLSADATWPPLHKGGAAADLEIFYKHEPSPVHRRPSQVHGGGGSSHASTRGVRATSTPEKRGSGLGGARGQAARGSFSNGPQRRGRGDWLRDSDGGGDVDIRDGHMDSHHQDNERSEEDTPDNPQLRTNNPSCSAQYKRTTRRRDQAGDDDPDGVCTPRASYRRPSPQRRMRWGGRDRHHGVAPGEESGKDSNASRDSYSYSDNASSDYSQDESNVDGVARPAHRDRRFRVPSTAQTYSNRVRSPGGPNHGRGRGGGGVNHSRSSAQYGRGGRGAILSAHSTGGRSGVRGDGRENQVIPSRQQGRGIPGLSASGSLRRSSSHATLLVSQTPHNNNTAADLRSGAGRGSGYPSTVMRGGAAGPVMVQGRAASGRGPYDRHVATPPRQRAIPMDYGRATGGGNSGAPLIGRNYGPLATLCGAGVGALPYNIPASALDGRSPVPAARVASPSAVSAASAARPRASIASSGAHVQQGLLYGSLLPRASLKTALLVENDEQGLPHRVDPHGDAAHPPLLDRGTVFPIQLPHSSDGGTALLGTNATQPQEAFPLFGGAVSGVTQQGVQPLAWKSEGSGFVMSRTGHIPVERVTRWSSHYVPPGTLRTPQKRASVTVVAPTSPRRNRSVSASKYTTASDARHRVSLLSAAATPLQQSNRTARSPSDNNSHKTSQLRYAPFQQPTEAVESARRESATNPQRPRAAITNAQGSASTREANAQRFGIAALRG